MKMIAYRTNQTLKNVLLYIIALTFMLVWLPLLRSLFDGISYEWGMTYFGIIFRGAGISIDYLFLIAQMVFYAILFYSSYWSRQRWIFYVALVIWFLHNFGNLLMEIILEGDTMFHGETLNVHVSLTAIVIPLSIVTVLLIGLVIRKDLLAENSQIQWSSGNNKRALIIFGVLPIQAVLFALGEPHGIIDQIGVIITILQCLLVPLVIRPYANS